MRYRILSLLCLLAIGGLAIAVPAAAEEPDYPWCTNGELGGRRCSFTSYEQCHASANGHTCYENPYLLGARAERQPTPQTGPKRRSHRNP